MKIFLIDPKIKVYPGYNYGLGHIASVLKKGGHSVDYIALRKIKDSFELYNKIQRQKPDIIGFSVTTSQAYYIRPVVKTLKETSDAFIICGGIHPTLKPEYISELPGLDAIVRGEGEFPMLELADTFQKKENHWKIKNFWFKNKDEIVKNELRSPVNLDELPFPDKSMLDYQKLLYQNDGMNRFIFSRGCLFDCPYCANKGLMELYRAEGGYYRRMSPQRAIEEIELDAGKYAFKTIFFDDDLISLNKNWFYEFFTLYKKRFKYPFYCNVRPGTVDSDMVKLLKEAGAKGLVIGIEHGNEGFRKTVLRRNITNDQIVDMVKLCKQYHIKDNIGQIMIGLPFETRELFFDTLRLCRELNIHYFFYIFVPYSGTEFDEVCIKNNWLPTIPTGKYYIERQQAIMDYPTFSKEDIQLCYDVFWLLTYFRFLPLKIPFLSTGLLLKFYQFIATFFDFFNPRKYLRVFMRWLKTGEI